jgi:hypothetical protein
MVTRTQISFIATGDKFRPSSLDAPLSEKEDPGVIGKRGRYRGLPMPHGSASFYVPETEEESIRFLHALACPLMPALRAAGATDFFIHITYHYDQQCTLGFDEEEVRMLAEFGCNVSIDCYKDHDDNTQAV